ncbi:MAG: S24/S26 family peptidase [Planctomycetota bacterium]|nr:S24/S26 family peptidase [Planctomycetota bacterium]
MNDVRRAEAWIDDAARLLGESGAHGRLELTGTSMLPHLRPGDGLWVDFSPRTPRPGDVVVFRQAGALLVHRVLGYRTRGPHGPHFRIRGDHADYLDGPTLGEAILGHVVAFERAGIWRDLTGRPARVYARLTAAHAFCWTGLRTIADRAERALGGPWGLARFVGVLDRAALKVAAGLLFRLAHRRRPEPTDA